jgi:hypothetical protein
VFISSAPANTIGGTILTTPDGACTGACNVISGNGAVGVEIYDVASTGNYVQGNDIGTDLGGTHSLGNTADGIYINNAPSNVIGGTTASARNVISGNHNSGVYVSGADATSNVIQGNHIGTDTAGTGDLGNTYDGVRAGAYSSGTSVGGATAGTGNVIAYNEGDGVMVDRSVNNAILGNSVFSNVGDPPVSYGLGIDLVSAGEGAGVTANDDGDGDSGGNNYQNFPVLTLAVAAEGSTAVNGTFNSIPSTNGFRLEFFSNDVCDGSGYGEGKTYLGFTNVNTNAGGDATFNVTFPAAVPAGWFITATATDPSNNTSEFSQCLVVSVDEDSDGDGCLDAQELAGARAPRPGSTGAYNPLAWYDFFDVPAPANPDMTPNGPKNQAVTMSDMLAVLRYVGTYDGDMGVPNSAGVAYDSDKMGVGTKAGLAYDRSPSALPNPPWDAGPPNGAVNMQDVLAALVQVGLDCSGPP